MYVAWHEHSTEQYFIFPRGFSKGHEDPKEFTDVLTAYDSIYELGKHSWNHLQGEDAKKL